MTGLPLLFDGEPRRLARRGRGRHYWLPAGTGVFMRTVCDMYRWEHVDEVRGTEHGLPVCSRCFAVVDRYQRQQAAHTAEREAGSFPAVIVLQDGDPAHDRAPHAAAEAYTTGTRIDIRRTA